jgi:hypothetical protein
VKLANTVPVNDGTTITTTLTVQNLSAQPWGTTDGTTADPTGVRVFFLTPPTSPVTSNAPFTGTFTTTGQKYFQYSGSDLGGDGILSPGETSLGQTWVFTLNGAPTFTFQLLISTAMPAEQGVLRGVETLGVPGGPYFNAVWGSAANDVWAAGQTGMFSHWTGTAWSNVANDGTSSEVNAIWGSSASNVYAVGTNGVIQVYDGASWQLDVSANNTLYGVWGSSATDVWTVGAAGVVVHFNGSWAYWTTNLVAPPTFAAVWGSGPTNVYAVGASRVARYDGSSGTSWAYVDISAALVGGEDFRTIWGSSANDIWVAGTNGTLLHYVSGTWTRQSALGSATITGIWGTSASDVYAVSESGDIWHYNGLAWVAMPNTGDTLYGVWGSGTRDVWAVGTDGVTNAVVHGIR